MAGLRGLGLDARDTPDATVTGELAGGVKHRMAGELELVALTYVVSTSDGLFWRSRRR